MAANRLRELRQRTSAEHKAGLRLAPWLGLAAAIWAYITTGAVPDPWGWLLALAMGVFGAVLGYRMGKENARG